MLPVRSKILIVCLIAFVPGAVYGQDRAVKPMRIVTGEPGGNGDFVSRLIAQGLSDNLRRQVIVDNRGGSVIIPAQIVASSPPDGATMLLFASTLWLMPFLRDGVPYDLVRDFAAITLAVSSPNLIVVHPSVSANSVKELIALAQMKAGLLNYGSGGIGSTPHLAAELFKVMTGVNIVHVPYKGGAPALNDLIGGRLQIMFPAAGSVALHLKSGRLRALAVTSAQPSALFPDLPTVAASGVPGYEAVAMTGIFAAAKTPLNTVRHLNQHISRVLIAPAVKAKLLEAGIEVIANAPEQFSALVKADMARMGKVIKEAGIHAE